MVKGCCCFAPITPGRGDLCPGDSRAMGLGLPTNRWHLVFGVQFSAQQTVHIPPWHETLCVAECYSVDILVGCCYWCDVDKPIVLDGGCSGVLRGGFCLVLVGLFPINGSLEEELPKLSWDLVRLWIEQLLQCEILLHVIGRLYRSHPKFARNGPPVFPLFAWVLGCCCSYSCWDDSILFCRC